MNKSFTFVECLIVLFIMTIMLDLSLNFLLFENSLKSKNSIYERGE
jgi:competence protein ComGC